MPVESTALAEWSPATYTFTHTLGTLVQGFQVSLPKNGEGIPVQYIDPTVIGQAVNAELSSSDEIPDYTVKEATIQIDFDEGFPTVDGIPFWERLDGEPIQYYKLFKQYRELKYVQGSRAIAILAKESNAPGKYLNALARVYHWQARCLAYDQYKKNMKEVQRRQEIEDLNDKHAKVSNKLLEQSIEYLNKHPEQLNPKVALQMLQLAIKTGRLSAGLNPDKPGETSASSLHNTNINIQQSSSTMTADNVNNYVETKTKEQANDVSHLQSVLHVLDKSGALAAEGLEVKEINDAEIISEGSEEA